jgi:hypothetical protein
MKDAFPRVPNATLSMCLPPSETIHTGSFIHLILSFKLELAAIHLHLPRFRILNLLH